MAILGKLERVDLRRGWERETQDFTPWLAMEENLIYLGRAIGLELELVSIEHDVGPYRADILCKDVLTQGYVLIENQLEKTNHNHLGQILTYAAGIGAKTIVWIAENFTEQHRAALDWLNEITEEDFGFFALEVELWKIGDSLPAPKFNVVSKPNDWRKAVAESARDSGEMPARKKLYLEFWTDFKEFLLKQPGNKLRPQRPSADHWTNYAIGRSGFWLAASVSIEKQRLGAEIFIRPEDIDPKDVFHRLHTDKVAIEQETGFALEWQELPSAKGSRIVVYQLKVDLENEELWPNYFAWLATHLEGLERAFRTRVRLLQ